MLQGRGLFLVLIGLVTVGVDCTEDSTWNDLLQFGGEVEVSKNDTDTGRSFDSILDNVEEYLKSNEITLQLPFANSAVTLDARKLDNEEIDLKLKFDEDEVPEGRKKIKKIIKKVKKSKIRKVVAPIFIFIILKAMTLIPLALGVLAIKTWNAIQISFISFVSAVVLAVWKLCSKINHEPPHIIHQAWDPHHHHDRSDNVGQQMAYAAYIPQQQPQQQ